MCPDCEARRQKLRQAFIDRRLREMVAEAAKGTAEMLGVKEKTGVADQEKTAAITKPERAKKGA